MDCCNLSSTGLQDVDANDIIADNITILFRLNVSGGSESNMSVSMFNVNNFLKEIFLFDDLSCDWGGCYRGEFSSENLEVLEELLDENNVGDNIKEMIIKGYRDYNGMDEE